jgi:cytochrome c553
MKLSLRTFRLSALLLLLLGLAACSCGDREDRLARIRGAHGRDAAGGAAEPEVALSPGAKLYREKTCNTCHGDDGIKALLPNYPIIARQGRDYALKQMLDIQSGSRTNGQSAAMKAVVATVTLEEFEILADYVANELGGDAPIGTGVVDPESPGAKLYMTKTCVACHGADGKSPILAEDPRIAGNTKEYALQQMQDVKTGARANSMAVLGMQGIMHLVNEEEMKQLAEYIASLPR